MRANDLQPNSVILKKFDKIPFVDNGDNFIPDMETMDEHFEFLRASGYQQYEDIRDQLASLSFSANDVESALSDGVTPEAFAQWRKDFENYCLNQWFTSSVAQEASTFKTQTKGERVVLNKRNPFANVAIQDQAFLYPGRKGYEVLSFTTNRHFIKKETDEGDYYAIVPGFKVAKQHNRNKVDAIVASDSVSTLLPEQKDDKRIVYI